MTKSSVALYEEEKIVAMTIINTDALAGFVYMYSEDVVGHDKNGAPTTLRQELKELGKLVSIIHTSNCIDYYHSRRAFNAVERDVEMDQRLRKNAYLRAGKKLLFLNSVCKSNSRHNEGFICRWLSPSSDEDMQVLVDAYEWVMRQYTM